MDIKQVVEAACLARIRESSSRRKLAVLHSVGIDFRSDTRARLCFEQDHVHDLTSTTHVDLLRGAANDFDIVDIVCANAAQLTAPGIALASDPLTVDKDLARAAT